MICEVCGCTDENACFDGPTGQVCGWSEPGLCTFCAVGGPPSKVWPEEPEEMPDLGPCCSCGESGPTVRNIVMLERKAPVAGTGWGCFVCGIPQDGAVAMLCDQCFTLQEHERRPMRYACNGYPADGARIPVSELLGEHYHRTELHEGEE